MSSTTSGHNILLVNQSWLREELVDLGNQVFTAGTDPNRGFDFQIPATSQTITEFIDGLPVKIDRLVVFDDSSTVEIFGYEKLNIPSVFYSVDAHHHARWHKHFSELFDLTLVAQRQHIPEFGIDRTDVHWFPLWPLKIPKPATEKKNVACFRGNLAPYLHPERAKFFEELEKLVPVDASTGDWVEPYCNASIVINQTVVSDLNFRYFEAIAAGALLITPSLWNGFETLFKEGEEYIAYDLGSASSAAEKIKYYLKNPDKARLIADRGREKLLQSHTGIERAEELLRHLSKISCEKKNCPNISAMLSLIPSLLIHTFRNPSERANIYLDECFRLMKISLEEKESLEGDFPSAGILTLLVCLLEQKYFKELEIVANTLLEQNKVDSIIGALFVMLSLMEQERIPEALEFSKKFSSEPSEFMWGAPVLLKQVRETVLSSIQI